jgi:hypothetical protein
MLGREVCAEVLSSGNAEPETVAEVVGKLSPRQWDSFMRLGSERFMWWAREGARAVVGRR